MTENVVEKFSKQVDEVLRELQDVKVKLSGIEVILVMQPQIDKKEHDGIEARFRRVEKRVELLEEDRVWIHRLVIGTAFTSIVGVVMAMVKFLG